MHLFLGDLLIIISKRLPSGPQSSISIVLTTPGCLDRLEASVLSVLGPASAPLRKPLGCRPRDSWPPSAEHMGKLGFFFVRHLVLLFPGPSPSASPFLRARLSGTSPSKACFSTSATTAAPRRPTKGVYKPLSPMSLLRAQKKKPFPSPRVPRLCNVVTTCHQRPCAPSYRKYHRQRPPATSSRQFRRRVCYQDIKSRL